MADPTFVQFLWQFGDTGPNSDPLTLSGAGKTVEEGDSLFVVVGTDKNIEISNGIGDDLGNIYSELLTTPSLADSPSARVHVWRTIVTNPGVVTSQTIDFGEAHFAVVAHSFHFADVDEALIGTDVSSYAINDAAHAPYATAVTGEGLHLFCVCSLQSSGTDEGVWTPPTGYTAIDSADTGTVSTSRRVDSAYFIGNTSGLKTSAYGAGAPSWHSASFAGVGTIGPPALTASYSFDGVTVR